MKVKRHISGFGPSRVLLIKKIYILKLITALNLNLQSNSIKTVKYPKQIVMFDVRCMMCFVQHLMWRHHETSLTTRFPKVWHRRWYIYLPRSMTTWPPKLFYCAPPTVGQFDEISPDAAIFFISDKNSENRNNAYVYYVQDGCLTLLSAKTMWKIAAV